MDAEERDQLLTQGEKLAWRRMLGVVIQSLGTDGDADRWRLERADVVSMLRQVCEEFGDNDWEDNLHLADVIEKHLWRNLM